MEIKPLDFFIGLALGAALGIGGTILVTRIRGWLGHSEVGRLRNENRVLARRLAEKDRQIGRMLAETQRLAERLGHSRVQAAEVAEPEAVSSERGSAKLLSSDP